MEIRTSGQGDVHRCLLVFLLIAVEVFLRRFGLSARGIVVYLEPTIEKQLARTKRDKRRPLLQTEEAPRDVLERLAAERNPMYEEIADLTVRTDDQSAKAVANEIINKLGF